MFFKRMVKTHATVLSKEERKSPAMLAYANLGSLPGEQFKWEVAFKTDDGIEKFVVEANDAARMFAGATGTLKYRGTHFVSFVVD